VLGSELITNWNEQQFVGPARPTQRPAGRHTSRCLSCWQDNNTPKTVWSF